MAAFVCYRICCRQLQHVSNVVRHSSQVTQPALLVRQAVTVKPATSWWRFCQNARHYHSVGGRQRGVSQPAFTSFRSDLWRGFRSNRKDKGIGGHFGGNGDRPGLLRPIAFTIFTCGAGFLGCMVWQYEAMRIRAQEVMKGLDRRFSRMFEPTYQKEMGFRAHMNAMWNSLSDGQKMVIGVIALNFIVFCAWKHPPFQPVLLKYFACMPGNPTISMILSAFSHFSLWHIAANMYVLWSFANVSVNIFGREQWLAVYLSAASISSLASLANKVFRYRFLPVPPSLGASGAIMCLLGAVCVKYPNAQLSIAFVGELYPHSFSASNALKAILLLDTAGLVLGWKMFDHAAHLGGVLFGMWYVTYGHRLIWGQKDKVMQWWHGIRKPSS